MTNIFLKRVEKLLDGLPAKSYAEVCKPVKETVHRQTRKATMPSEFELHNQVLQNTWGRIEFEIERNPVEGLVDNRECNEESKAPSRAEYDCRVRIKTRYRMAMQQQLKEPKPKAITIEISPIAKPTTEETPEENIAEEGISKTNIAQEDTNTLERRIAAAKAQCRKEFYCRESRQMTSVIAQHKAKVAGAGDKNIFVNFSLPVLSTLARSPQTPKNALKWLAFHESAAIRKSVAKNLNTDLEILELLAHDEDKSIRLAVAENPLVTKEFLIKLLNDNTEVVAKKAKDILHNMTRSQANESNLATLKALSDFVDGDEVAEQQNDDAANEPDFLQTMAAKDTTPRQRLKQLSKHDDWNIRRAVAANPNTTYSTLSCLAKDPELAVRKQVLANSNCPPEIILNMATN